MPAVIVFIVFAGIIVLSVIDNHYSIKKRKIDAALRMREMEAGVAPGTYSRYSKKDAKRDAKKAKKDKIFDEDIFTPSGKDEEAEREELLKGIQDLKERIANIDTIMAEQKKNKGEEVK